MRILATLLCVIAFASPPAPAQTAVSDTGTRPGQVGAKGRLPGDVHPERPTGFEENKGQIRTLSGEPAPYVRYRYRAGGTAIYLLDRGIAYQFDRFHQLPGGSEPSYFQDARSGDPFTGTSNPIGLETFRMDMELEGAHPAAFITTEGRSTAYFNYYTHDALDVHLYQTVIYHEVYPGIDWVVRTTPTGIEYDWIVHPGGDPSSIRMRFRHHEELRLDADGRLLHGNRLGLFTESAPIAYVGDGVVPTTFHLDQDLLTFDVGGYDRSQTLRIDPPRVWATYFGGPEGGSTNPNEQFENVQAVDEDGSNIYVVGYTRASTGIADGNVEDTSFNGVADGFIAKFNSGGDLLWASYYGGSNDDSFVSCAVFGNFVYAAGKTNSDDAVGSIGVEQDSLGGDWDALLVKFNTNGFLAWGTYCGGQALDKGTSCSVDAFGNVFLAGTTSSTSGISENSNHQPNYGGNNTDGFLVKFNPVNGQRFWGTYNGGNNVDEAYACAADNSGNVYLVGGTGEVPDTSMASPDSFQPVFGGQADAYLAKFGADGHRLWATYFGGTMTDYGFACTVDGQGNVYVAGDTYSNDGIHFNGGFQDQNVGGARDAFLAKFDPVGNGLWGTFYGGSLNESGRGCSTDAAGNVFLVGEVESSTGIAENGHQMTFGGGAVDAFMVGFNPAGDDRLFGTYYGGTDRDEGYGVCAGMADALYMVGRTYSGVAEGQAISTPGAGQEALIGTYDGYIVKFRTSDCENVPFGTTIPGAACNDGSVCSTGDVYNALCQCTGTPVPGAQWEFVEDTIPPICQGGTLELTASATGEGIDYHWTGPNGFQSFQQDTSIINAGAEATGPYTVTAFNGCGDTAVATVVATVNEPPTEAVVGNDQTVCTNGTTDGLEGNAFTVGTGSWSIVGAGAGTFDPNDSTPNATFTHTGGVAPITLRWTIINAPCAPSTADVTITIDQPPTTADVGNDQTICASGITSGLGGNTPAIGTGSWSIVSDGDGFFSPNDTIPNATFTHTEGDGPIILRWTIGNIPCAPSTADVTITINQPPTSAEVGGDQVICVNGTTSGLGGNTPALGTGSWDVQSGGEGTFSDVNSPDATFTHTSGTGPLVLRWTISNEPCPASSATLSVTFAQAGDPCSDGDPCTLGDELNGACECEGTPLAIGTILGNTLLADGMFYQFEVSPVIPGVAYAWLAPPGWPPPDTLGTSAGVEIAVPVGSAGPVPLCVTTAASCDTTCIEVFVMDVGISGEDPEQGSWSVRPNPGEGSFELVRFGSQNGSPKVHVLDPTGRLVFGPYVLSGSRAMIDMHGVPPGTYLLRILEESHARTLRIMVRR